MSQNVNRSLQRREAVQNPSKTNAEGNFQAGTQDWF